MTLLTTDRRKVSRFNWTIFFIILILVGIGLINLHSALGIWGKENSVSLFWSQIMWVSIGFFFFFFFSFFDYRLVTKGSFIIYLVSILLLIAVLFFGKVIAGHRSWLSLGGIALQPSEFAKLALIIMLTKYFSDNPRGEAVDLLGMWKPFLLSALPAMLVISQGDLGSAIFFILLFISYAWLGRLRRRGIFLLIVIAIVGSILLYFFGLSQYQKSRIVTFLNPDADARGSGYHLVQSKIAVGSGMFWGKGYKNGNINKLRYLPEKHTDFIFPVLAEEWGFVGAVSVLFLYFLLFVTGIDVAKNSRDRIGLFLAFGIVAFLFWHIVINVGGVLGLMPLTGVTFPLLSYGGSSTIIVLSSLGMLMNINMRRGLF